MNSSPNKNIDELIISLQDVLKQFPNLKLGILFGSMATGKNHPESDLDLAVLANQPLSANEKMALIAALANKIGRPVDLIDLKKTSEPLLGQILKQGKRIFGSNTDYAQLITRHVFEQTDFMPYRARILDERRKTWIGK